MFFMIFKRVSNPQFTELLLFILSYLPNKESMKTSLLLTVVPKQKLL